MHPNCSGLACRLTHSSLPGASISGQSGLLPWANVSNTPFRLYKQWEHEGNKAVRRGKWKLVRKYPGHWELYDIEADRTEMNDLSHHHPDIVADLKRLYDAWAERCNVLPYAELLELRRKKP